MPNEKLGKIYFQMNYLFKNYWIKANSNGTLLIRSSQKGIELFEISN